VVTTGFGAAGSSLELEACASTNLFVFWFENAGSGALFSAFQLLLLVGTFRVGIGAKESTKDGPAENEVGVNSGLEEPIKGGSKSIGNGWGVENVLGAKLSVKGNVD